MKKAIAIILSLIMVFAFFGCSKKNEPATTGNTTTTTEESTEARPLVNPLTNSKDFRKGAVGKRPVAIVVENLTPARPQWGIETPDIIVEGEVEGGISRMLWLYADYTKVPEKVGPIRSARPSYVKFSQLFDSIFIHWGGSHSKSNYVGGYSVITELKVDHIDGMKGGALYGRDTTRSTSSEHRGIIYGKKVADTIKEKKFRTDIDDSKFSVLNFNDKVKDAGKDKATKIGLTFSSRTDTRAFEYSNKDKKYHTNDWKADVSFTNVIILSGESTYYTVTSEHYKSGVTYLNYALKGGDGYYASNGTITKIKWTVKDKKLVLTDESGADLKINSGNSYIGLASSNNGGKTVFSANAQ